MVCEMTVPPWVPLFATVSAVVGTHIGTSVIRDGMTVTVDGAKGLVRIDSRV